MNITILKIIEKFWFYVGKNLNNCYYVKHVKFSLCKSFAAYVLSMSLKMRFLQICRKGVVEDSRRLF